MCTVEFRRMGSNDPWTLLGGLDDQAADLADAADNVLRLLEELLEDGLVFSTEQTQRLARALRLGGGSA